MADSNIDFLALLNSRLSLSKKFAKEWFKDVKKWIKSYEIDSLEDINAEDLHNKLQIPYIFSTVESALPSMFNSFPQLILTGRGKNDQPFGEFVDGVWKYVYDKTSFEEKIENAGTMFLITGIGQVGRGWTVETEKVEEPESQPILNSDGSPVMDETGQPMTQEIIKTYDVPVKDMPLVEFKDYKKIFYSPESEFVVDDTEGKIPYIFEQKKMMPEEIKEKYDKTVDEKTYLNVKEIDDTTSIDDKELVKDDLKRVDVYDYQGILPKKFSKDADWKSNRIYHVVFTTKKILKDSEKVDSKTLYQVGNYGVPTKFWKFGEPRILWDLEKDISFGRSTLIDYRDKFATKIAVPAETEIDERTLKSPKKFAIVKFSGTNVPQYITPPPMPETVLLGIEQSRQDVAMTSAQLDIGRGGQTNQVDTATGQRIFQEAQSQRIERKRRKIAKFIEAIARGVLLDCSKQWDVETFAKIVDMDSADPELADFVERLKGLGEEFDIQIEPETVVSNRATEGAQTIALYREMKDDPLVNREEVVKEVIRKGFGKKDVDRFLSGQLTPEQMAQAVQILVQQGAMDPAVAEQIIAALQGQGPPGQVGRPPSANPTDIMKKSMPAANETQITAQNQAAYKQQGVAKGPRGV